MGERGGGEDGSAQRGTAVERLISCGTSTRRWRGLQGVSAQSDGNSGVRASQVPPCLDKLLTIGQVLGATCALTMLVWCNTR